MFDSGLVADAAQFAVLGHRIAAAVCCDTGGPLAAEALGEVLAAVRAGELATCRLMERVDRTGEFAADGAASTVAYLRGVSGEANGWAAERVLLGRALADRMPATAAGWQHGDLGLGHASVIRKTITRLDDDLAADIEKALAEAAPHITPAQLADLAAVVKAAAAPDDAAATAKKNHDHQTLSISKTFDGMYRIDGWLDTEAGAEICTMLTALTRKKDPNLSILEDPIGKRRAEALHLMARHAAHHTSSPAGSAGSPGSPGSSVSPRHHLIVAMTLEALQSGIGSADIQGHGPITAAAARRLACDSTIIPAVLGTDSQILDLGAPTRLATPTIRRHLALRDGGCLFPGCDRPPPGCEAHHRQHWIDGGPTTTENLDTFCLFHHHLLHEGGWTYRPLDPHTLQFTPPHGKPPITSKRQPLLQPDLNQRLHPQPTVRIETPHRT